MKTTFHFFLSTIFAVVLASGVSADQTSEFQALLGQNCAKKCPFQFYGWMEAGITVNNHGSTNEYDTGLTSPASRNLDPYSGNSYLLMTEQPSDVKLNQLWVGMTKKLDTRCGFDWGFTGDFVFGTDAKYTQSFGDHTFDYNWGTGDYYSSIAQLYAEAGYGNLRFKVGKFAPCMTHEVLPAVASFFYSHAYTCYNTPLTLDGAIAEYQLSDRVTVSGGWTAGYHSSFGGRFNDNGFLGGVTLKTSNATSLRYSVFYTDNEGVDIPADVMTYGRNYQSGKELIQTLVFTYQINRCWFYMIEGLYTDNDFDGAYQGPGSYTTKSYGINQHLIYTINSKWAVGLRGEWQRAEGTIFDAGPYTGGQGGDLYEITLGANWNVCPKVMIRPELRYDWTDYDNGRMVFAGGTKSSQLSGGVSTVVKF